MLTQRGRYLGAMVGTLCGDALGAPVEWLTPQAVADYFAKRGGYSLHDYLDPWAIRQNRTPKEIKAGQPTDDSELAAALATSLVECAGLDEENLYYHLRDFIHGNNPEGKRKSILTKKAYGKGQTLSDALLPHTYAESLQKFEQGEVKTPPSNGSLMRCVGIPLAFKRRGLQECLDYASRQSCVTHRHPEAVASCFVFTVFMRQVLTGMPLQRAWEITRDGLAPVVFPQPELNAAVKVVLEVPLVRPVYETEMKGKEGWAVLSLRVALWAALTASTFRDGIEKAISVGGDTDTYAAIAGGILGAHFGYQGIPVELREPLQGRKIMEKLGNDLYDLAHPDPLQY